MCGRYVLPEDEALQAFGPFPGGCCRCAFRPRYNVPPTAQVPIVVSAPAGRQLRSARWGLVPGWWTKETPPPRTFNARMEDVAYRPIWRDAWRAGRCLLPARGWFEWRAGETARAAKQPFFIACPAAPVFAFAGLWALREAPGAEPAASCAVLTKDAAPGLAFIHPRMPVVLKPEQIAAEVRRHLPGFTIAYAPDHRQAIADSWPRSIDDSAARTDWGWKPQYDLKGMVDDMMLNLTRELGK